MWARKQREDCKDFIIALGKRRKFVGKVIDWNEAQVLEAYQATKRMLSTK